jgi:hypothetical protein
MVLANAELMQLEKLTPKALERSKLIEEKALEIRVILNVTGIIIELNIDSRSGERGMNNGHHVFNRARSVHYLHGALSIVPHGERQEGKEKTSQRQLQNGPHKHAPPTASGPADGKHKVKVGNAITEHFRDKPTGLICRTPIRQAERCNGTQRRVRYRPRGSYHRSRDCTHHQTSSGTMQPPSDI